MCCNCQTDLRLHLLMICGQMDLVYLPLGPGCHCACNTAESHVAPVLHHTKLIVFALVEMMVSNEEKA